MTAHESIYSLSSVGATTMTSPTASASAGSDGGAGGVHAGADSSPIAGLQGLDLPEVEEVDDGLPPTLTPGISAASAATSAAVDSSVAQLAAHENAPKAEVVNAAVAAADAAKQASENGELGPSHGSLQQVTTAPRLPKQGYLMWPQWRELARQVNITDDRSLLAATRFLSRLGLCLFHEPRLVLQRRARARAAKSASVGVDGAVATGGPASDAAAAAAAEASKRELEKALAAELENVPVFTDVLWLMRVIKRVICHTYSTTRSSARWCYACGCSVRYGLLGVLPSTSRCHSHPCTTAQPPVQAPLQVLPAGLLCKALL